MTFHHNFCESRIYKNQPEYINAVTSLFITIIPLCFPFPVKMVYRRITLLLMMNGFCSLYYHLKLNWVGKQLDELTMIFCIYIALIDIVNDKRKTYAFIITDSYFIGILVINSIPSIDFLFPILFAIPILSFLYFLYKISKVYDDIKLRYLLFSVVGAISWIISETVCNKYTYIGHGLWHFFFPLGFIKLLNNLDYVLSKNIMIDTYVDNRNSYNDLTPLLNNEKNYI